MFIYINFSTGNPNGTSAISFKDERVQDPLLAVKKFSGNCNLGNGRLGYFENFCNVSSAQCSRKFFSCEKLNCLKGYSIQNFLLLGTSINDVRIFMAIFDLPM